DPEVGKSGHRHQSEGLCPESYALSGKGASAGCARTRRQRHAVKILNGMSSGLPIVFTSIGCEGIESEHGRHLLIADTAEDFAASTLRLLEDPELGSQMGLNARKLVETTYNYLLTYRPVEKLYCCDRPPHYAQR